MPKEEGVFDIKRCDCERFNLVLLSKLKWRILNDKNSMGAGFLSCKYGDTKVVMLENSAIYCDRKSSLWWRDLCIVGEPLTPN